MSSLHVTWVDDVATCRAAVANLLREVEVAVDLEGVDLGRHPGKICVLQACGRRNPAIYLFDITALQNDAFEAGKLRTLFESPHVLKVLWDVRSDTDALHHNHGVDVMNAYDLQVLYHLKFCGREVDFLTGLKKAFVEYGRTEISVTELQRLEAIKEAGVKLFSPEQGGSFRVWEKRPLAAALKSYCAADVKYLLGMKQLWGKLPLDHHVLEITPQRIADFTSKAFVSQDSKKRVDFQIPRGLVPDLPAGIVQRVITITPGKVGLVIGVRGQTINRIETSSGAKVSIQDGKARIVGTPAQVEVASSRVLDAMSVPRGLGDYGGDRFDDFYDSCDDGFADHYSCDDGSSERGSLDSFYSD